MKEDIFKIGHVYPDRTGKTYTRIEAFGHLPVFRSLDGAIHARALSGHYRFDTAFDPANERPTDIMHGEV